MVFALPLIVALDKLEKSKSAKPKPVKGYGWRKNSIQKNWLPLRNYNCKFEMVETLTKLLMKKGIITNEEFFTTLKEVQMDYKRRE